MGKGEKETGGFNNETKLVELLTAMEKGRAMGDVGGKIGNFIFNMLSLHWCSTSGDG